MMVDTSVWVDFFNHHPSPQAQRLTAAIQQNEPIAIVGLIYTEILLGLKNDTDAQRVSQLLAICDWVQEPSRHDYAQAAKLYRDCRSQGVTIRSTIDCLIAQLCIRDNLTLLAKDRDFEQMVRFSGLRLLEMV
jgi:predicted nucleic acid-binding protein